MPSLLKAGKIVNTHGIRGEIRVYPLCDSADFLTEQDGIYIADTYYEITSARVHKNLALLKLKGIDHIDQAEPLIGQEAMIDKDRVILEEGRYFIEDLKGMTVLDADTAQNYGTVRSVIQTGANDVFEVVGDKVRLVPKIDSVVLEIDMVKRIIYIRPLEGLFDE